MNTILLAILFLLLGAGIMYLVLFLLSGGLINYTFTNDKFKCAISKFISDNLKEGQILDVTQIYSDGYNAASMLHGCHKPKQYKFNESVYTLENGHYK